MAKRINDLGRDRVGPLMLRLAVPAVTAQLVNALYNIVDRMYIGRMKPDGDLALTGLGVTFAIIMFVAALAALVGVGGGSRAAIKMGARDEEAANAILGNCTVLIFLISILVTVFFQIFKDPMLLAFGASELTLPYASDYLGIYLWGTLAVQISLGLNNFITTQGFSTTAMLTVVIGAVINIVLDPIFIFGMGMGVKGAALATIIAQMVSALWVLLFLTGRKTRLRIQRRCLRLSPRVILPVVAIGVSPFIMQSTESLVNVALNSSLQRYGGDMYVGAMTIASSVMQVLTMPFLGLAQGTQPIVGYNFGAGQMDRVRRAFKFLFISGIISSVAAFLAVQIVPGAFVAIFNDNPALMKTTEWAMHIYFGGMFMLGVQFSCQQTFVALGQAKVSLVLALLRKVILLVPLIYLLPLFMEDKVFAVYFAEPVADILAGTVTGLVFFTQFPRILKKQEHALASAANAAPC